MPEIVVTFVDDSDLKVDDGSVAAATTTTTAGDHRAKDHFVESVSDVRPPTESGMEQSETGPGAQIPTIRVNSIESLSRNQNTDTSSEASQRAGSRDFIFDRRRRSSAPRKFKDPYAEMMEDFEEYYSEEAPDPAAFFAPEAIKTPEGRELTVRAGAKKGSQRSPRNSAPDAGEVDPVWEQILANHDVDLHAKWTKQGSGAEFMIPSKKRIKFRWIHVPANNMLFCPAVLQALAVELREPSLQRAILHKRSFNSMQHVPRHTSSHGRFMTPSCSVFLPEQWNTMLALSSGLFSPIGDTQMCLFYPYLHWDTLGDLKSRNDLSERRRRQGKPYPTEPEIFDACLEHQLIWFYLNSASDLPLHLRRSLDQYGYPNLSNTEARDLDQILSKRTRAQHKRSTRLHTRIAQMWDKERGKADKKKYDQSRVLMVDTMWLWVVERGSVVTFFPSRRHGRKKASDANYNAADVHDRIYNDVNGDPRFARQCQSCFDFAALAILHTSIALLESSDEPDLQVFGIFEEYLSELTELQTKSFKKFRDSQLAAETHEGEKAVREMMANLHNRDDLTALLELRDISDELRSLDKLFAEQIKVIDQMTEIFRNLSRTHATENVKDQPPVQAVVSLHAFQWLHEAKAYIVGYSYQSKDMQERCSSVQEAYKLLLDMKQKQANVAEASLSRLSAEVASEQNRAIMIFTIFTIIFLPLSFFTSLFGMNVREWSGESTNPDFHQVFLTAGCISAGIVIIALTLAFNKPIRQKVVSFFNRSIKHWPSKVIMFTYQKLFGSCFGDRHRPPARAGTGLAVDVERGVDNEPFGAEEKTAQASAHKLYAD